MPAAAQGGDDRTAPTRVRSSGPGQDQPPRIDPWAVSIANVLDGDAGEQEPEQFTTLCHGPGRPGSRQVEERLPQNGVGVFPVLGESLAGSSETVAGQRFSTVSVQVRGHMPTMVNEPRSCETRERPRSRLRLARRALPRMTRGRVAHAARPLVNRQGTARRWSMAATGVRTLCPLPHT